MSPNLYVYNKATQVFSVTAYPTCLPGTERCGYQVKLVYVFGSVC